MLVTISHIFHRHIAHAGTDSITIHTRRISFVLLASNVQFNAQSYRILLDELKVRTEKYYFNINTLIQVDIL